MSSGVLATAGVSGPTVSASKLSADEQEEGEGVVIARIWRGATREGDAEAYAEYLKGTGLKDYRETPATTERGCCGG